jgi:hypothetical protein
MQEDTEIIFGSKQVRQLDESLEKQVRQDEEQFLQVLFESSLYFEEGQSEMH